MESNNRTISIFTSVWSSLCMRASHRLLRWATPFGHATSRPWPAILNKANIRRHAFPPETPVLRRTGRQARAFSSTLPTRFMLDVDSTIYALSTAPGRAAIAVVRVSGPASVPVCNPAPLRITHTNNPLRYTKPSAQTQPSQNPALQPSAPSTTQPNPPPTTQSSTPAP
jgi:hypothetical protein